MRKKLLNRCSSLGDTFVDIDDEKRETLDKLLHIDIKLASGEIKKMLWQHVKEIDWEKNTEALVEIMIELKKLFKKLQTVANSVLFREERINDKVLKKLKKFKYNKDINL